MSGTQNSVPAPAPVLSTGNVTTALGTTLAGIAIAAPQIANVVSNFHLPTDAAGWIQLVFGGLMLFAR